MKFAVSSVRHEMDAQECMDRYQLGSWGGVVRSGTWRERHQDGREHDSIEDSWVELDLEWDELPRFEAHVRQLASEGRPAFRGLVVARGRTGDAQTYRGTLRWFVGPEIPPWSLTIFDSYMD